MNCKQIVTDWLKKNGFDGLCNPNVQCACLAEDLAPCGLCENMMDCEPGHREDVDEHAVCDCDGQGEKHWHIVIPLHNTEHEPQAVVSRAPYSCSAMPKEVYRD